MTSSSLRYTDLINIIETDTEIEVSHKTTHKDCLLKFDNVFSLLSSIFNSNVSNNGKYFFGFRKTFKVLKQHPATFVKSSKFTLLTKEDYLKPIGFFYNIIKTSCASPTSKVFISVASGISFHTCLLSCNISGVIPVLINSAQTNTAISNALIESKPSIILLDNKSAVKLLDILKSNSKVNNIEFIKSLSSVIFDETDFLYADLNRDNETVKKAIKELKEFIIKLNKDVQFYYFNITNKMDPFSFPSKPIFNKEENDHVVTIYTSGSTSEIPKGVIITNENLVSGICAIYQHVESFNHIQSVQPRYLSYLPLSHVFELLISYNVMLREGVYAFGNPKTLTGKTTIDTNNEPSGDFKAFKPNIMCAVPLVLSRLRAGAEEKIMSKGMLVNLLYKVLFKAKEYKIPILSYLANAIFFNKIKEELGGDILGMISGGAFLCDNLKQWIINVLGVKFCEGYALTETCAIGLYSLPNVKETKRTYVGIPTKQNKAIIIKTDEYYKETITDSRRIIKGSLLLEGNSIADKYVSGDSIKNGNRIITGDIVELQLPLKTHHTNNNSIKLKDNEIELGVFKIVGREKENVKLSNGEFYNLVQYEHVYKQIKGIKQCMVYINKENNNEITLILNTEDDININKVKELEKEHKIHKNISVKKVVIIKEEWSMENGCLTPTLKLKRFKIIERYQTEIKENGILL